MKKIVYTVLGAALMLASCQQEANDLPQTNGNYPEDGVVRIATHLNAIQTRADEPTAYAGGNLSLSVDYGTDNSYTVHNNEWTNSSGNWSTTSQMLWKSATAEAKIYAYAPFVNGVTNITDVPFSVAADQSAGLTASDLVGYKNDAFVPGSSLTTKQAINIAFAHKLAKLKVVLTFGDQFGGANPAIAGVTIGGTLPNTNYNATIAQAGAAKGTVQSIIAHKNGGIYEAIIIPQTVTKDTRLVIIALENGDSYVYTISATDGHTFLANTENTINLRIGKDAVTLASPIKVNDWTESTPLDDGETELVYFPDPEFVKVLVAEPYSVPLTEGIIDPTQAATKTALEAITTLNVEYKGIESLQGIEYMPQLQTLRCEGNRLTALDISKNTKLTDLYCYNNNLTTLDLSQNTSMIDLYCYSNSLTDLDVSKNTNLTYLDCSNNSLTNLDVSQNTSLTDLSCITNSLTVLDVSQNINLTYLYCYENSLTALDVSQNTKLTYLGCNNNSLTTLDVSQNTKLTYLYCETNSLTVLDVSQNTNLENLWCHQNHLTDLDVTDLTALDLGQLYCGNQKENKTLTLTLKNNKPGTKFDPYYDGRNQRVTVIDNN